MVWFPSPTGVNHYEYDKQIESGSADLAFPSPTGVNHYESSILSNNICVNAVITFPSPTGVNHYEY